MFCVIKGWIQSQFWLTVIRAAQKNMTEFLFLGVWKDLNEGGCFILFYFLFFLTVRFWKASSSCIVRLPYGLHLVTVECSGVFVPSVWHQGAFLPVLLFVAVLSCWSKSIVSISQTFVSAVLLMKTDWSVFVVNTKAFKNRNGGFLCNNVIFHRLAQKSFPVQFNHLFFM